MKLKVIYHFKSGPGSFEFLFFTNLSPIMAKAFPFNVRNFKHTASERSLYRCYHFHFSRLESMLTSLAPEVPSEGKESEAMDWDFLTLSHG